MEDATEQSFFEFSLISRQQNEKGKTRKKLKIIYSNRKKHIGEKVYIAQMKLSQIKSISCHIYMIKRQG